MLSARLLGVADRGNLALLGLLPLVLAQLAGLGLPLAATYYLARETVGTRALLRLLIRVGCLQIAGALILQIVLLLAVLQGSQAHVLLAAAISVLALPAIFVQQYGLAILQGQQRFRVFNTLRLVPAVLFALALAVAAALGHRHLETITALWVASFLLPAICTVVAVSRQQQDTASEEVPPLREMLRFGIKGLLGSASPIETFRPDQAVVGFMLSPAALGLYVVGVAFANFPRFVAQSLGMIAYPTAAQRDPRAARRVMWRFTLLAVAAAAPIVATLELAMGWLLPALFGPGFDGAIPVARILLLGALFLSVRRVMSDAARGSGYPSAGSIAEIVSWVTFIPAMVSFANHGVTGVAWALTISAGVGLVTLVLVVALAPRRSKTNSRSSAPQADSPAAL